MNQPININNVNIREINVEEISIIQFIAKNTWPNTFGKVMPKEQIDYMLDLIYSEAALIEQIKKNHVFLIAFSNGNPLGFASYELNYNNKPQLMIHKIYLLPHSQGFGLGIKFFNMISDIAIKYGLTKLCLKVFYKNQNAIGFYEKYGFKSVDTIETNIGNDYIIFDYLMEKEITK
jgi:diamine N-acetyltransferase